MSKYQFTNKAVEDLSKIWDYTYDQWSENQADKYYSDIIAKCQELASNRNEGTLFSGLIKKLKGSKVNRHIIFYRELSSELIEVERILHERMDLKRRLSEK